MSSRTFRVWAPRAGTLALRVRGQEIAFGDPNNLGWYEATAEADHGDNYFYVVDGEELPDPWSRWQPDGLRGPSRVFEPRPVTPFQTPPLEELVIYELHVGAFTRDGTFDAAIEKLAGLAELGITAIELMPIAEFPGRR